MADTRPGKIDGATPRRTAVPKVHYQTKAEIAAAEKKRARLWLYLVAALLAHAWVFVGLVMWLSGRPWGTLLIAASGFTLLLSAVTCVLAYHGTVESIIIGVEGDTIRT